MATSNDALTSDQHETLKTKLLQARAQIVARAHGRFHQLGRGASAEPADAADLAKRELDESLLHRLDEADRERLAAIDAALDRMVEGTYGFSVDSGEPIGFERLQIEPWATRSVRDQEQAEHSAAHGN